MHLSNIFVSLTKSTKNYKKLHADDRFRELVEDTTNLLLRKNRSWFGPREISNITGSLAEMDYKDTHFLEAVNYRSDVRRPSERSERGRENENKERSDECYCHASSLLSSLGRSACCFRSYS